jgi:hypothetical protein
MSFDLPKINDARRRKGRPLLTRAQAESAANSAPADIDITTFLISLITSSAFDSSGHESGPGTDSGFTFGDGGSDGGGGGGVDSGGG